MGEKRVNAMLKRVNWTWIAILAGLLLFWGLLGYWIMGGD